MRGARRIAASVGLVAAALWVPNARAQVVPPVPPARPAPRDTVPAPPRPDTTARRRRGPRRPAAAQRPGLVPPVTARRAFLSSLLVPGLGQSRLGRPTAGAVFAGLELGVIGMLIKSNVDLHVAQSFKVDTIALSYPVDSTGAPAANPPRGTTGVNQALVNARRLHREDWVAALVFNHLISGAEAFVSANLYDLPAQISARPSAGGGTVVALSIPW